MLESVVEVGVLIDGIDEKRRVEAEVQACKDLRLGRTEASTALEVDKPEEKERFDSISIETTKVDMNTDDSVNMREANEDGNSKKKKKREKGKREKKRIKKFWWWWRTYTPSLMPEGEF